MKTYPNYNSYISTLKYSNVCCDSCCDSLDETNQKLNDLQEETDNVCITEVLYNSPNNTNVQISTTACVTFIENPIDMDTSTYSSNFYLVASNIKNGTSKQIINHSTTTTIAKKTNNSKDTTNGAVNIISVNNYNQGGFNNLGTNYNCYTFSSIIGDTLSITWSEINNAWDVISYGGIFSNVVV
jgi:hypothetical protein